MTRRPLDTRRTFTSQRLGSGSLHTQSRKESALETCCEETTIVKGEHHADDDILQRQFHAAPMETRQVKQQGQRGKSAGAKDRGARRHLRTLCTACPRDRGRRFPLNQNGWPMFLLIPVTPQSGVGSRSPPARTVVRAVTATKHEPGLSLSYRVVSYGLALEVWAFLVRLSHCQRARSEVFAVVPLWRAAWIRWLSVVKSEAAAKH